MKRILCLIVFVLAGSMALAVPAGAAQKFPGIGSNVKAWANAYGKAQGNCVDCYGPEIHNSDSGQTWMYAGVDPGPAQADHVVLIYDMNLAPHTPWLVAENDVLRMLPKDAVINPKNSVTIFKNGDQNCGVFTATSATLAKMRAMTNPVPGRPKGADPTGVVQVSMSMQNASNNAVYDPNNVQSVTVLAAGVIQPC
jgi:hypothetical protein